MASKNIKGITIEIGGDSTELQKALQKPEKDARSLKNELGEINNALKFNPESIELLGQKSKVLSDQVRIAAEQLALLKKHQKEVQDQAARGDIGEEQLRAYNRLLVETESQVRHYEKSLIDVDKQISSLSGNTKSAADSAAVFEEALKQEKKSSEKAREETKQHGDQLSKLKGHYKDAEKGASSFSDSAKTFAAGDLIASSIKKATSALLEFASSGSEAANQLELNQRKLELALFNVARASGEQIDHINKLIESEERLGIVSARAQTAALAELSTYTSQTKTLELLLPALNDLIAFSEGVGVSQERAAAIATKFGRALDGNVGTLKEWGFEFSESQKKILSTGSELSKANVIVKVVNESLKGQNYYLRQNTKEGEKFERSLAISKAQEKFGTSVEAIKDSLLDSLLPSLATAVEGLADFVSKNERAFEALGKIIGIVAGAFANLIMIIGSLPPELVTVIALLGAGLAVFLKVTAAIKQFNTAQRALQVATGATNFTISKTTGTILVLVATLSVLLFLILAIKDGSREAADALSKAGNAASSFANTNVNTAKSPRGYATGTKSAARGLAWVGEKGPELVNFRGGEQVFTAKQSAAIAASNAAPAIATPYTYTYNDYSQVSVRSIRDFEEIRYEHNMSRIHDRVQRR